MKGIPQGRFLPAQNRLTITFWLFCLFFALAVSSVFAHPITGVWRGRIQSGKGGKKIISTIEVKFVDDGENIVGTVYYLGAGKNYIRYSLKGSFWGGGNSIYWQDYSIVNMKVSKTKDVRDFNETMKYFANYSNLDEHNGKLLGYCILADMPQMEFELKKIEGTLFPDEWDPVIDRHSAGKNNKEILDSVWAIASGPVISKETGVQLGSSQAEKQAEINQLNPDYLEFSGHELALPERIEPATQKTSRLSANQSNPGTKPEMLTVSPGFLASEFYKLTS